MELFTKAETLFERHERHILSFALIFGFVFDSLTLQRIDLLYENLVIVSYLVISGGSILLLNYYEAWPSQRVFLVKIKNLLPLLIQFAFGGLFSAFLIFYTKSANLLSSWPFVLILMFFLVGNEFFRSYYQRLTFQVSIYFVAIFSFFIFFLPVMLKTMGAMIFLLSGLLSLLFILLFSMLLSRVVPVIYLGSRNELRKSIFSILIVINVLYFSNLIPPIPLALKDAGVYYSIERVGDRYHVVGERRNWYESIPSPFPETIRLTSGAPLYVFSSVFAPTDLNTTIVHDWQYFDTVENKWISVTKIIFSIKGGRDGGYRGFSQKANLFEGEWRVDVKTERNQVIGRVRFNIETSPVRPALREETL